MKTFFSERSIAIVLFIMVLVIFSFAQKDAEKIEAFYNGSIHSSLQNSINNLLYTHPDKTNSSSIN